MKEWENYLENKAKTMSKRLKKAFSACSGSQFNSKVAEQRLEKGTTLQSQPLRHLLFRNMLKNKKLLESPACSRPSTQSKS